MVRAPHGLAITIIFTGFVIAVKTVRHPGNRLGQNRRPGRALLGLRKLMASPRGSVRPTLLGSPAEGSRAPGSLGPRELLVLMAWGSSVDSRLSSLGDPWVQAEVFLS